MKYTIQWRDIFGFYHDYQTQSSRSGAYRTAQHRCQSTGKTHRIIDEDGSLVDLIQP